MIAAGLSIVTPQETVAADALIDRVARAASALADAGVGIGDCVALLLRNDLPFLEASLACRRLGAYCVPINWHSSPDEIRYVLDDCGAKLLIAHADLLRMLGNTGRRTVIGVSLPSSLAAAYRCDPAQAQIPEGVPEWRDWIAAHAPIATAPASATETLIYTSGTTGNPKGVRRQPATPDQAAASERMRRSVLGMGPHARVLVPAPLYHTAPNLFAHRAAAIGDLLVLPPRFDAEAMLADIERHRITHVYAVPAMFKRLLALPYDVRSRYDTSTLEVVLHAGGPCAPELKRAMIDWLGPVILEYYGSTEAGPITQIDSHEWLAHVGTVGRAIDGMTVRIVGEDGAILPDGEIGEVRTHNPHYPDFTYLNRQADRDALDHDGMLASGDLGYLRDGWLYLCDRKRDMVVSGGVNIYPAEIEAALLSVAGVADCAVFGVPDEDFGEGLMAIVQPEPAAMLTEAAVQGALRTRIAGYKVPRRIEFRDTLPREDSGKIKKRLLRDPYWAGAGRSI